MDENDIAIGIDLGTTNSCAAYYHKGKLKVLENNDGDRITPSFLYFTEKNKVIVGKYAKMMAEAKSDYAVYEIKRLMGRKFDDFQLKNSLQYFSFNAENDSNEFVIVIDQPNVTIRKSPMDISAAILTKIRKDVETKLGCNTKKAVITVPAYFNVNQREATLAAAEKAGFTVLKLLNEPTAAALSYYYENESQEESYSLVYDLGGGTFDVALLKRDSTNIDIISVDGDSYLGGKDFDNLIIDYVCEELQKIYKYNPKNDRRTMRRLQNKCEEAKKLLSSSDDAVISLEAFVKNNNIVTVPITKSQFETMGEPLFKKTIDIVDLCLRNSNISKNEIKEVILSGGSTRIPRIQEMLSEYFDGKNLNKFANPDECVAEGAALQAAMLSSNPKQNIEEFKITDVIPLSLGLSNFVNKMTFLINKNTPIPVTEQCVRSNLYDKQKSMLFEVYEGERLNAKKNRCLGTFTLTDLTPAPPGQCKVTFTMTVDQNGILKVTAKEKIRNNVKDLKIVYTRGNRSDSKVMNAVKDAEDHWEEDERFRVFITYKSYVVDYCISVKYNLEERNLVESFKDVYNLCSEIQIKAYDAQDVEDLEEMKLWKNEIKLRCDPLVKEHKFKLMPIFEL